MTRLLLALAALALAAPGPAAPGPAAPGPAAPKDQRRQVYIPDDRPPPQGVIDLQKRKYRMAASIFRKALQQRPDALGTQTLLGHAYAGMHRCDQALPLLLPNVSRPAFGFEAAQLMASCYARDGELGEAVYWMEQAAALAPANREVQASLAFYELSAGDQGAWERLALALAESPEEGSLLTTQALMLLHVGAVDAVEPVLEAIKAVPGVRRYPMSFFVEARLELDLGNPVRAEELFGRAYWRNKAYVPSIVLWGESARRNGVPEEARYVLDNTGVMNAQARHDFTRAIRARIAVDEGDLVLARALVDEELAADALNPEAVASAWYLARAQARTDEMARWSARYALVQTSALRTLEQLIPLG